MKTIPLTKGYSAVVDDEDYERVMLHNWHVLDSRPPNLYAATWKRPKTIPRVSLRMHHLVLGVEGPQINKLNLVVDHIDRDGLNNQKSNLRIVNRSVNAINSARCDNALGIYFDTVRLQYKAIELPGRKFIGWFHSLEEAYEAKWPR